MVIAAVAYLALKWLGCCALQMQGVLLPLQSPDQQALLLLGSTYRENLRSTICTRLTDVDSCCSTMLLPDYMGCHGVSLATHHHAPLLVPQVPQKALNLILRQLNLL